MSQPGPADASRPALSDVITTTAIRVLLWLVLLLDLSILAPWVGRTYQNYNMRLPGYTAWTVTLSDWAVVNPGLVAAGLLLLLLVDVGILVLLWRGAADVCQLWSGMMALATLVVVGAVLVSSLLPLVRVLQGLSR